MKNGIIIECVCPICSKITEVEVEFDDYCAWKYDGVKAQNAFPYLTPSERECLISGICDECWADI